MVKQENISLFMEKNKIPLSNCVLTGSRWRLLPKKATLLDHMLQVGVFRGVQFDVIFSQDLHDGPDFQPPLYLRDAAPATDGRDHSLGCLLLYLYSYNMWARKYISYSKSVSSFNSARGWKVSALFLIPSTQAESAVLAKIRPKSPKDKLIN